MHLLHSYIPSLLHCYIWPEFRKMTEKNSLDSLETCLSCFTKFREEGTKLHEELDQSVACVLIPFPVLNLLLNT